MRALLVFTVSALVITGCALLTPSGREQARSEIADLRHELELFRAQMDATPDVPHEMRDLVSALERRIQDAEGVVATVERLDPAGDGLLDVGASELLAIGLGLLGGGAAGSKLQKAKYQQPPTA